MLRLIWVRMFRKFLNLYCCNVHDWNTQVERLRCTRLVITNFIAVAFAVYTLKLLWLLVCLCFCFFNYYFFFFCWFVFFILFLLVFVLVRLALKSYIFSIIAFVWREKKSVLWIHLYYFSCLFVISWTDLATFRQVFWPFLLIFYWCSVAKTVRVQLVASWIRIAIFPCSSNYRLHDLHH